MATRLKVSNRHVDLYFVTNTTFTQHNLFVPAQYGMAWFGSVKFDVSTRSSTVARLRYDSKRICFHGKKMAGLNDCS